jgi:hypothetical protein
MIYDKAALSALLLAINACEKLETELQNEFRRVPRISGPLLSVLYEVKNGLGCMYQTNEELVRFDDVFTECGWTNKGLRWTTDAVYDEDDLAGEFNDPDIFIVQFTNEEHTAWRLE